MPRLVVLWDESHFWGLLLHRALAHWGLEHRLVSAAAIADGALENSPDILLVPGGLARRKTETLGTAGVNTIRAYVAGGGTYLGFCGGAGLGLADGGLEICPWSRRAFTDRLQHFVSGHMRMNLPAKDSLPAETRALFPETLPEHPLLPVWWPARFEMSGRDQVDVLAAYREPGPDLMLADIPLGSLPKETLSDWENLYGVRLRPTFMQNQPCLVHGRFGKGRYLLSYAHLETPSSRDANHWLAHLLRTLAPGAEPAGSIPAWELDNRPRLWDDPHLSRMNDLLSGLVNLGREHLLLFWRNPWLLGWRRGIPGAALNSLLALAREIQAREPSDAALAFWREHATQTSAHMELFHKGVTGYLLAERLAMTMATNPDGFCITGLKEQKAALFGPPPSSGGVYGRILSTLEPLARLALQS